MTLILAMNFLYLTPKAKATKVRIISMKLVHLTVVLSSIFLLIRDANIFLLYFLPNLYIFFEKFIQVFAIL